LLGVRTEGGNDPSDPGPQPRRRLAGIAVAVVLVMVVGYFALGMPGMDHSPSPSRMSDMDH
jgi:hypothetical protein